MFLDVAFLLPIWEILQMYDKTIRRLIQIRNVGLTLRTKHLLQLITWLQSGSPNWMVVTSTSSSTANAIEQFIFSAEPHSHFLTFVHCVVMRGGPSWTFSNGLAWRAIRRATSYTRIKRIASISTCKVIFYTICFCVTSIINIPPWCGIHRIYRFSQFK